MTKAKTAAAVECHHCELFPICQTAGLEDSSGKIDQIVHRRDPLKRGDVVIKAGQMESMIIAVQSGTLSSQVELDGKRTILDYHIPGELAGMETLGTTPAPYDVVALDRANVCRITLPSLTSMEAAPTLMNILKTVGLYLCRRHWLPRMLSANKAEQRVALFLLGHSERLRQHGLENMAYRLPLSQQQVAQYLGLAMETVNRTLRQLQNRELIEIHARQVRLLDPAGLAQLSQVDAERLAG